MESGRSHRISRVCSEGRLGSVPSYGDSLELIAERYGSHPTICQSGWKNHCSACGGKGVPVALRKKHGAEGLIKIDGERVLKCQARADARQLALFMSLGCESVLSQTLITSKSIQPFNLQLSSDCQGGLVYRGATRANDICTQPKNCFPH